MVVGGERGRSKRQRNGARTYAMPSSGDAGRHHGANAVRRRDARIGARGAVAVDARVRGARARALRATPSAARVRARAVVGERRRELCKRQLAARVEQLEWPQHDVGRERASQEVREVVGIGPGVHGADKRGEETEHGPRALNALLLDGAGGARATAVDGAEHVAREAGDVDAKLLQDAREGDADEHGAGDVGNRRLRRLPTRRAVLAPGRERGSKLMPSNRLGDADRPIPVACDCGESAPEQTTNASHEPTVAPRQQAALRNGTDESENGGASHGRRQK